MDKELQGMEAERSRLQAERQEILDSQRADGPGSQPGHQETAKHCRFIHKVLEEFKAMPEAAARAAELAAGVSLASVAILLLL
eukprot:2557846-Lingulodinium_polyedra.AAC.1